MGKVRLVKIIFLLLISNSSFGQEVSTKDSISNFFSDFFASLKSEYLNREDVHWEEVESYALDNALKSKSFTASLNTTTLVFDTIRCNHCKLFSKNGYYESTLNKSLSQDDFNRSFLLKYQEQPPFEVKLINENIGYIQIPGMLMIDLTKDSLNSETQKMYDQVVNLAKDNILEGWIVDLRFNSGGNVYPMLVSLHYLIGDNVVYKEIDANGTLIQTNKLNDGGFYCGGNLEAKANTSIEPNLEVPVAIITGKMTGSSGEDIAVAFKNRKNTLFVGEKSYGLLTGNGLKELPYEAKLALTTCYIVDDNEVYREYITPDIIVSKGDDFGDFDNDGNIIKAIDFFKSKEK